jgi:hypothetical protein
VRRHYDIINALTCARKLEDVVTAIKTYDGDAVWLQRSGRAGQRGAVVDCTGVGAQRRARHLSLGDVFRMELVVACTAAPTQISPRGTRAAG